MAQTEVMPAFYDKLDVALLEGSLLCLGLDPDLDKLPAVLPKTREGLSRFCHDILDAVAPCVCGFKFQIAYFAAVGAYKHLKQLIAYVRRRYPRKLIILDAKRGDIASTAVAYAQECFQWFDADAVTLNPYMGWDSVQPFLDFPSRGVFVLCRTSNLGATDFQTLALESGEYLYQRVARVVATQWNAANNCGLVVGATAPSDLRRVREQVGDALPLLVPGVGTQGGCLSAVVHAAVNAQGTGLILPVSRAVIYANNTADYAQGAAEAARSLVREIDQAYAQKDK